MVADVPRKMMDGGVGSGSKSQLQQQKQGASNVIEVVAKASGFPTKGNTIHTLCTSNGSPYLNFQNRIMCALILSCRPLLLFSCVACLSDGLQGVKGRKLWYAVTCSLGV